jgi:GTP-binding protein
LLGKNRSIVTEVSGTTRDAVHSTLMYQGQEVVLVDTAGLRRKSKIKENVEFYSLLRTERAIQQCDVAVMMIDATMGLEAQDIKVLKRAEEMNKGLVIAVNKWDLVEKETNTARDFTRTMLERLKTLDYIPVLYISALTKQRIHRVLDTALVVAEERAKRIPTSKLNEVMLAAIEKNHPATYRGHHVKIKYVAQVREDPPVFAFFCNYPQGIQENFRRYLERAIRDAFGFEGVPINLAFKAK